MNTNLKTTSVQFSGRTLIVSEATLRMSVRMLEMAQAATAQVESNPEISPVEAHFLIEVYPRLAACTTAEDGEPLPTPDEFLDGKDLETNEWYVAVGRLSPHWFPDVSMPEEEVKKKRTRSKRGVRPAV